MVSFFCVLLRTSRCIVPGSLSRSGHWKWKPVRLIMPHLYNKKKKKSSLHLSVMYFTLLFKVLKKLRGLFPLGLHYSDPIHSQFLVVRLMRTSWDFNFSLLLFPLCSRNHVILINIVPVSVLIKICVQKWGIGIFQFLVHYVKSGTMFMYCTTVTYFEF